MDEQTRRLIRSQADLGRVVSALMLEVYAQLSARGWDVDEAVELATVAGARVELPWTHASNRHSHLG